MLILLFFLQSYTKAINMGAGDDTVVYAAAGAGGSLNGGDGNDTLVVSADSAIAGLPEVSGFEVLEQLVVLHTMHIHLKLLKLVLVLIHSQTLLLV